MSVERLRTALHGWHAAHGARLVDFAGWEMPVQYSSIVDEHRAVRQDAGIFDVAHMGRLRFEGRDVLRFLNHVTTNDVAALQPGQIQYSLVPNDAGGILDDVLVYRLPRGYAMVVNASNRPKILSWFAAQRSGFDVEVVDDTESTFMLAIQGPAALGLLQPFVPADLAALRYYTGVETDFQGSPALVSRTGYTGEDGFEVTVSAAHGAGVWTALIESGGGRLLPCGLGCRDTLRLEAAMPLYGHELNEQTDPFSAGLAFAVKLDKGEFIGRAALRTLQASPPWKRVGLELSGRRIAREGTAVFAAGSAPGAGTPVGSVTSGTFSPTLSKSIAMAYVRPEASGVGNELLLDIRGTLEPARVVKLPFYRRAK